MIHHVAAKQTMNTVPSKILKSFENAAIDSTVEGSVREMARQQMVYPRGTLVEKEYVPSPLLELLIASQDGFAASPGIAHILYAPSSTGKTTALRYFVQVILKSVTAPALMISGYGSAPDYLEHMAVALGIRDGREGPSEAEWIASLVAGLVPRKGTEHAPVLVLDEFDLRGEANQILDFADAFSRFIYEKGFTVIFVTKSIDTATELCKLNQWQKIGPLPHLTTPDRWSLGKNELPPDNYTWKTTKWTWTTELLTQLILKRTRFSKKFDDEVKDGRLEWLEGVSTPTTAIFAASEKLASKSTRYKVPSALRAPYETTKSNG